MSLADATREWLLAKGTATIDHAGGSLYDHLGRVHDRLAELGGDADVRLAGLTHAAYGTDGFGLALLDVAERAELRALIGAHAEEHGFRRSPRNTATTSAAGSPAGPISRHRR